MPDKIPSHNTTADKSSDFGVVPLKPDPVISPVTVPVGGGFRPDQTLTCPNVETGPFAPPIVAGSFRRRAGRSLAPSHQLRWVRLPTRREPPHRIQSCGRVRSFRRWLWCTSVSIRSETRAFCWKSIKIQDANGFLKNRDVASGTLAANDIS